MKFLSLMLFFILLLFYSCNNSDERTCATIGCKAGKHCDVGKNLCVVNCTEAYCSEIGEFCNPSTKECDKSCEESGCSNGKACDSSINKCIDICTDTSCDSDSHCDKVSGLCKKNCIYNSCNSNNNEVCDPETRECIVKATTFCTINSCANGSKCNEVTGYCTGGCSEINCEEEKVCNPEDLTCIDKCSFNSCTDQKYCNTQSGLCENFLDYPSGPYLTKFTGNSENTTETDNYETEMLGKIIENISWKDSDNKSISLLKYYSLNNKSDFPLLVILNETSGDCEPCEAEADALGQFYKDNKLENGFPRYEIIETLIDDDVFDGNMADPSGFANSWKEKYHQDFPVIGDLERKLEPYNSRGKITYKIFINAKTMKVEGFLYGSNPTITNFKAKVRQIEKKILCDKLKCNEQGSYCIYKDDHTAKCN